jgi:hypothetical protein
MKQIFTIIAFLTLCACLQAQITIDREDFTLSAGDQYRNWLTRATGIAVPEEGMGLVWDYSNLNLDEVSISNFIEVSTPDFPEASMGLRINRGIVGGIAQQGNTLYYSLDANKFIQVGELNDPLKVPMALLTGGVNDTLNILPGIQTFSEPKTIMQFPLNFGDKWQSNNTLSLDFLISVAAFGLQNTPSGQTIRDELTDEVVGYGTMILPNPVGEGTVSLGVLMVKRTRISTYNYTLAGMPAPQLMLDILGLEQDFEEEVNTYLFYAKGIPRSAVIFEVFTPGVVTLVSVAEDIANIMTSTFDQADQEVAVQVFPNPARDMYQVAFEKSDALPWTFEMFNSLGQLVHQQVIEKGEGRTQLQVLCASMQPGYFRYILRNYKGMMVGSGSVILH